MSPAIAGSLFLSSCVILLVSVCLFKKVSKDKHAVVGQVVISSFVLRCQAEKEADHTFYTHV